MHDNKVRLSQDVLEKAEMIASEWGLKNARAAVEAVFRRYSDEYLLGRGRSLDEGFPAINPAIGYSVGSSMGNPIGNNVINIKASPDSSKAAPLRDSEAMDALDDLLAM